MLHLCYILMMINIAIITGASSGMGKEFANQISTNSLYDEIWIIARRKDKLDEISLQLNNQTNSKKVIPIVLDISKKESIFILQNELLKKQQELSLLNNSLNIQLLINNAGFGTYGPFDDTDINKEMEMVDLNCTALTGITGISIPFMHEGSQIINTASMASYWALGNFAVYGASKAYVLSFTIALAAELKHKGIKVCALCPGPVSTEFANVASNGERKEVKHGVETSKVVKHCLKQASKNRKTAIYAFKWKIEAFGSHLFGKYLGAWATYKFCKRPYKK
jgi:uncharacterized protein